MITITSSYIEMNFENEDLFFNKIDISEFLDFNFKIEGSQHNG